MHIPVNAVRIVQRTLADLELYTGAIDGQAGPATEAALGRALAGRADGLAAEHRHDILNGSRRRKLVAWLQLLISDQAIEVGRIDGYWGPQTDTAFEQLDYLETFGELPHAWRDFKPPAVNPNGWPVENESELSRIYGPPGQPPLHTLTLPYPLKLSWSPGDLVTRLSCHEKVADSLERVLGRTLAHYGRDGINELQLDHYGGCFNARRKRGGTSWSTHAWGIALDFDPDRNRLHWGRDRAWFARPEYAPWWDFWEHEGWTSLGRTKNFDWMHVQATRPAG